MITPSWHHVCFGNRHGPAKLNVSLRSGLELNGWRFGVQNHEYPPLRPSATTILRGEKTTHVTLGGGRFPYLVYGTA